MLMLAGSLFLGFTQARYGQGVGPIVLDDVSCDSSELRLDACDFKTIGLHNCIHSEDASVMCSRK